MFRFFEFLPRLSNESQRDYDLRLEYDLEAHCDMLAYEMEEYFEDRRLGLKSCHLSAFPLDITPQGDYCDVREYVQGKSKQVYLVRV